MARLYAGQIFFGVDIFGADIFRGGYNMWYINQRHANVGYINRRHVETRQRHVSFRRDIFDGIFSDGMVGRDIIGGI